MLSPDKDRHVPDLPVGESVLSEQTDSPYKSPRTNSVTGSDRHEHVHYWRGHTIYVASRPEARMLWFFNSFLIIVDDGPALKSVFRLGQTIPFQFTHNGQTVCGEVRRHLSLFVGRVVYSIAVEDESVASETFYTSNWLLAPVTFLVVFGFVFGPRLYQSSSIDVPAIVLSVVVSFACLFATMRMMVGDFSCLLPAVKRKKE